MVKEKKLKRLELLEIKPEGFVLNGKVVHAFPVKLTHIKSDLHYADKFQEKKVLQELILQRFNPKNSEEEEINCYVLGEPCFAQRVHEVFCYPDVYPILFLKII